MSKLKWFDVKLEVINKEVPIIARSLEELEGRSILFDLTRDLKGKMAEAKFKVHVKNKEAIGEITYYGLIQNYARRLVRKGTSPVEDSFVVESKDGVKLRVKPLLVTRRKVVRGVRKKLRDRARELLSEWIKKTNKNDIFKSIINYEIQKQILKDLKKIYPLFICEVRRIQIEK